LDIGYGSQRDFATGSSGISRSIHQLCVIITEAVEENDHAGNAEIDAQVNNSKSNGKKKKEKIHVSTGSGESSCQPSITAQKYPPIQEEKF
jgi:hypothetical protein